MFIYHFAQFNVLPNSPFGFFWSIVPVEYITSWGCLGGSHGGRFHFLTKDDTILSTFTVQNLHETKTEIDGGARILTDLLVCLFEFEFIVTDSAYVPHSACQVAEGNDVLYTASGRIVCKQRD